MRRDHEIFERKGVRVVCISQGDADDRAAFLEVHGPYPFPFLADPHRDAYVAYGLARGTLAQVIFNPSVIAAGLAAYQEGHKIESIVGDPFQLPGTFLVGTDGRVIYAHAGRLSSDFPSNDDVFAAIE